MLGALISITRPLNVLITFFSVLVGFLFSNHYQFSILNLKFWALSFSAMLTLAAGNIINDICDYYIDKENKPNRALPSGKLSLTFAKIFYLLLVILSLFISFFVNIKVFLSVSIVHILLFYYGLYLKQVVLLKNFIVAAISAFLFIFASLTASSIENVIPLSFVTFIFHFIREIIKDMADYKGDLKYNKKTIPLIFGWNLSIFFTKFLIIFFIIILLILPFCLLYGIVFITGIYLVIIPFLIYIYIKIADIHNQSANKFEKLSKIMKYLMLVGLIIFLVSDILVYMGIEI